MRAIVSGDAESFLREGDRRARDGRACRRSAGSPASSSAPQTRAEAESHARGLRRAAPAADDIHVLGPAEAPLALIAGRHRFRLLVQGERRSDMQGFIRAHACRRPEDRAARSGCSVDIDPQSFLVRLGAMLLHPAANGDSAYGYRSARARSLTGGGIDGVRVSVADRPRANGWHGRRPPSPCCSALILLFAPRTLASGYPAAADRARASRGVSPKRAPPWPASISASACAASCWPSRCSTWRSASPGCSPLSAAWCR